MTSQIALIPIKASKKEEATLICEYRNTKEDSFNQNILLVHVNKLGKLTSDFAYNVGRCEIVSITSLKEAIKSFENSENFLASQKSCDLFKKSYKKGLEIMSKGL